MELYKYAVLSLIATVMIVGCVSESQTISISGVGKYQEINSDKPVRLIISGSSNTIKVLEGTQVEDIIVSGTGIILRLPRSAKPKITDSGVGTVI